MKKILLFVFILSGTYYLNAQQCDNTLPVSEDFSDTSAVNVCWNFIDDDNDDFNWMLLDMGSGQGQGIKSHSYVGFSLSPDNWAVSNSINLSAGGSIQLNWKVRATAWDADNENYSVYVSTGSQISNFTSGPALFSENLNGSDASGVFANRSLNLSSFSGQTVYIAFRHHDVSGQSSLDIDDFVITTSALGIDDFENGSFKHYYNVNTDNLTIKSNISFDSIKIYNILGQQVIHNKLSQTEEVINLSNMTNGIYIAKIQAGNAFKTIKFIKQ